MSVGKLLTTFRIAFTSKAKQPNKRPVSLLSHTISCAGKSYRFITEFMSKFTVLCSMVVQAINTCKARQVSCTGCKVSLSRLIKRNWIMYLATCLHLASKFQDLVESWR